VIREEHVMSTLEERRAAALARLRERGSRTGIAALDRRPGWPPETQPSGYIPDPDDPFEQRAREEERFARIEATTAQFWDPFDCTKED
jgi:hypothetical protein